MRVESYIKDNNLEGKKIADVLRDYERGYSPLYHICWFFGYSLDRAVYHIDRMEA